MSRLTKPPTNRQETYYGLMAVFADLRPMVAFVREQKINILYRFRVRYRVSEGSMAGRVFSEAMCVVSHADAALLRLAFPAVVFYRIEFVEDHWFGTQI